MSELAYTQPIDDVIEQLESSRQGLGLDEVQKRQQQLGPNELPQPPSQGVVKIFFRQFLNPLIYVLLLAAFISIALENWFDSIFIFAVLMINSIIGTVQEHSAEKSAKSLRSLVRTSARVLRDGGSFEVDADELVPGDIVFLGSGSKVPADIRLIDTVGVEVDESLLTGESLVVSKEADKIFPAETVLGDRLNMVFSGSMVVHGRCHGVVVVTGERTQIGEIADSLGSQGSAKPPLLLRMERFTTIISLSVAVIILLMVSVELMRGSTLEDVFLLSVALAVSVIPEGLPVAITVVLAIGATRMARKNVVMRRLYAVEALGSCTFIASDKTGTLTMNELTAKMVVLPGEEQYEIEGEGYVPEGKLSRGGKNLSLSEQKRIESMALSVTLNNEAYLGMRDGEWVNLGDAVDVALQVFSHKAGVVREEMVDSYPLIGEMPFEPENRYSASLNQHTAKQRIHVKGAVEVLLSMCDRMATPGGEASIDVDQLQEQADQLAQNGIRVLAVATGTRPDDLSIPFTERDLEGLTFLGMIGMVDPLRQEVTGAIQSCRKAGIHVSMVTGDHPITAFAIAKELGMAESKQQVVTGYQLSQAEQQGEGEVDELTRHARVFARIEPAQKVTITQSLIRNGHFVAVTGDGANDAPALNAANVGVSMGKSGTDVARESSDMILVDDNFNSIVSGIREGRVAYANVRKVVFLLISTGASEVVLFFLSLLAGVPLPLLPAQLLWLNLVTNGIQHIALAFEPAEGDEMERPPRQPREPIFNVLMVERIIISALIIGITAFLLYWNLTVSLGMETDAARNSTLLLMVLFENVHAFNSRSERRSIFSDTPFRNPLLLFGTIMAQLIHISAMYIPWLQEALGASPISFEHWLELLGIALILVVVMEIQKKVYNWRATKFA